MIREPNYKQLSIEEFKTPFEKGLDKTNRWVMLASLLPWEELTNIYTKALSHRMGRPALHARVAIGAVIIKHKLCLPDEEVIPAIQENPYLQYFLGYSGFSHEKPFDPSLFVTIRKRLGLEAFNEMTDALLAAVSDVEKRTKKSGKRATKKNKPTVPSPENNEKGLSDDLFEDKDRRSGMLLLDASVAPADIKYPTDLDLLNTSREHSEELIDSLWEQVKTPDAIKPRTYRRVARKAYLKLAKKRKKKANELRKGIRKQLNCLNRNIKTINALLDKFETKECPFSKQELQSFWIIQELYRQQQQMYNERSHKIEDRIVSISQPHVRPIVRGKAKSEVEFGAKISASVVSGFVFLDRVSWDAYHEASDLPLQVEKHKERSGFYPEVVIADGIYGTRENRAWLAERNIRYSGKPLGRPPKLDMGKAAEFKLQQKQRKKEIGIRSHIEGKFGEGKRAYDLDLVKAKLPKTSESWIAAIFMVMNIARWLRDYIFVPIFSSMKDRFFLLFLYVKERVWGLCTPISDY
ncbi:IS5 family transposase [candidate division KSB1 bacterium]|nr:IS5 family transposase [candidate division KSB1 bacterium]